MRLYAAAVTALAVGISSSAHAQDAAAQARWSHEGLLELTWDHAEDSTDTVAATFEFAGAYRLIDRVTMEAGIVLEPVGETSGDAFFEAEGAYVESLFLRYSGDAFSVFGGKLNPTFGSASDQVPGLYGAEVGESYELTERVGLGGDINLGALMPGLPGDHVLSASVFTADRSVLSDSIGEPRGRVRLENGGVGNTEELASFAISLDGELPSGIGYTLGARRLAASPLDEADEVAFVAGIRVPFEISSTVRGELFAELFTADDADGIGGARRTSYTTSATFSRNAWHSALVASGIHDNAFAGGQDIDYVELSVGRDLADGLVLDAGIRSGQTDGENDALFGLRLSWEIG